VRGSVPVNLEMKPVALVRFSSSSLLTFTVDVTFVFVYAGLLQ